MQALLFALGFMILQLLIFLYEILLIALPCTLSRRYRRRYHHRLWNRVISFWGSTTCRLARWTAGLQVVVEGEPPRGRYLIVSNHQSAADVFVLFDVLRGQNLKFVVKKSLLRWLFAISYALRDGGFGVVDFSNRQQTLRDMRAYARGLEGWYGSPLIFPEGIRSVDGSMRPFKRAGLRLLVGETGLPVLPVVVDGLWRARSLGKFFLHLPGACCRVSVLAPVAVGPEEDSDELVRRIESLMRSELERLRSWAQASGNEC